MRLNVDLQQIVSRGVTFLLSENMKGYPEAVHYLTLPVGRTGEVCYKTYSAVLFARMLILDSLLDCADFDIRITKELVEKEILAILQAKHANVAGGWSYIPSLSELPPDSDDLAMVVQLLARTGGKQLASFCDDALHILFKYGSHPDGGFETWVVDPSDSSSFTAAIREYIKVIGGRGVSPDVVANLLWGLVLYDPVIYGVQITEGIKYLAASQADDGFWPSKWYWGKFYGTYRALTVLSTMDLSSDTIERGKRFLCNSQMADGGWGEDQSDALSTALGLLSLINLPQCLEEKRKGASWLACAQSAVGSWESSPFIRLVTTDGELTYASKTVTTAFCTQALARIMRANPELSSITAGFPKRPYRRDIGGLTVCSDQSGQWMLIEGADLRWHSRTPIQGNATYSEEFGRRPGLHIIELTRCCNQACTYCAAKAEHAAQFVDFTAERQDTLDRIVHFILESSPSSFCVEFQGGEPLLNFSTMRYIVETFARLAPAVGPPGKSANFRLVSNLTLLTPEIADYIAERKIDVSTSLDGIQSLHDRHRKLAGGEPTYSKVLKGIAELRKRRVTVGALMVVTRDALNVPEEVVDNFAALGLYRFGLNPVSRLGNADKAWGAISFDPAAYSRFWKRVVKRCLGHLEKGIPIWDRAGELLVRKVILGHDPGFVDLASPCGCVRGQMAYDLQGNVYPCDEARFNGKIILGNVLSHTFEDIVKQPETVSLRQASIITDERCGSCPYRPWCGRCPVVNRLQVGREDAPSGLTYQCQIWRHMFDRFFELLNENPGGMARLALAVEAHG